MTLIKSDLELLYQQKPNRRAWINPRNWFRSRQKEVYSSEKAKSTVAKMEQYLRNKKGFYQAQVRLEEKLIGKNITAIYHVATGNQSYIADIQYVSQDTALIHDIHRISQPSFIGSGTAVDKDLFDLEKLHIVNGLQDLGYAGFVSDFVSWHGDSTGLEVDLFINIKPPLPDSTHQKYTIGHINVYTDQLDNEALEYRGIMEYKDQSFYTSNSKFVVRPNILSDKIYLKKGEIYKKSNRTKTFKNLSRLSAYKYVYVNPLYKQDSIVDFDIYLAPHQYKYQMDVGFDLFYSAVNRIGQNLFGTSVSTSLQDRNFLGGSEEFSIDLEGAIEFDIGRLNINTLSIGLQNRLALPQHLDFLNLTKFYNKLGLISDTRFRNIQEESNTEITLGYNFTNVFDLYKLHTFSGTWGFDYRPNNHHRYLVQQMGITYQNPIVSERFQNDFLSTNDVLARSFVNNFSTGFLFRELSHIYQGGKNRKSWSLGIISNIELSGLEMYLANTISNTIGGSDEEWTIGDVNFAKFAKLSTDLRLTKDFGSKRRLVLRSFLGLGFPYGQDQVIPYIEQFYAGGPNSMRAWELRELGPGESIIQRTNDQPFFQAGDIKLELNAEFRFNFISWIEGALFVDAGNIWTLRENETQPGSKISLDFLDQMAIGAGWGIRFDFDYFLIRTDFGYKLRSPYVHPELQSKWILETNKGFGNINIAINYPF